MPLTCGHGDCINLQGSYSCQCHRGFGSDKEAADPTTCIDIDECSQNHEICGGPSVGRCINSEGSYDCECSNGFAFSNGTCVDIDECTIDSNPCLNGDCINTAPGFECLCYPGYAFRGGFCADINECEEDRFVCGEHGDCLNQVRFSLFSILYFL